MTEKELMEQFKGYLTKEGRNGYKSYPTYLNNTCRDFSLLRRQLERIAACGNQRDRLQYAEQMRTVVALAKLDPDCTVKKKTLGNYGSAIEKFITFLRMADWGCTVSMPEWITGHQKILPVVIDIGTPWVQYENTVPHAEKIPGLCQFFQDEYPKVLDFARQRFGDLIDGIAPYIPVYLSCKRPVRSYPYDEEFVAATIREACDAGATTGTIMELLRKYKPKEMPIAGEFYPGEKPFIILYYRNQGDSGDKDFYARLAKTFAHEYMHYLHYAYCAARNVPDPLQEKRLSEALADFFGVYYAMDQGDTAVAESRYQAWLQNSKHIHWPYAYARYFLRQPFAVSLGDYRLRDSDGKLRQIFCNTTEPALALDALVSVPV